MNFDSSVDDVCITRLVYYRLPKNTPLCNVPPQPARSTSKQFLRIVKYRPHITAKRKILWATDSVIVSDLFVMFTELHRRYGAYLCAWNSSIEDFSQYRETFKSKVKHRKTADILRLVDNKLIIPLYVRVNSYDFSNMLVKRGLPEICKLPPPPPGKADFTTVCMSDYVKDAQACWVPTIYAPDIAKDIVLEGNYWSTSNRGLHNKPYIENDVELSQHEQLRIMRYLVSKGWITK